MHALATLPVFFKLAGKRAVVAGGDAPALWKAELLASMSIPTPLRMASPNFHTRRLPDR
jgi:siroheme synthase (precorrin-2 oxidase/ferrochelatase)